MRYPPYLANYVKKPLSCDKGFLGIGAWRCATLTWGDPTLPSPLIRFTAEFEMESGGTVSLWPPGVNFYLNNIRKRLLVFNLIEYRYSTSLQLPAFD